MLRSALSLSLMTGQPFHMVNIRGMRQKSGLKRQHLACVKAALEVGNGAADGAEIFSRELIFHPGGVQAGEYHIKIGGSGSTSLVVQTLLPALAGLNQPSRLIVEGGTHNPMAPSYHFLEQCFLPYLDEMGYQVRAELNRVGFAPAGGGRIVIETAPAEALTPLRYEEMVEYQPPRAEIFHYNLPEVTEVMSKHLRKKVTAIEVSEASEAECDGMSVRLISEVAGGRPTVTEIPAEYGLSSSNLVQKLTKGHLSRIAMNTPVCNRVADQLMLYLAQLPGSHLTTGPITNHLRTNAEVIEAFLPGALTLKQDGYVQISSHGQEA